MYHENCKNLIIWVLEAKDGTFYGKYTYSIDFGGGSHTFNELELGDDPAFADVYDEQCDIIDFADGVDLCGVQVVYYDEFESHEEFTKFFGDARIVSSNKKGVYIQAKHHTVNGNELRTLIEERIHFSD